MDREQILERNYKFLMDVYQDKKKINDAVDEIFDEIGGNKNSYKMLYNTFQGLMSGKGYNRACSSEIISFLLDKIREEFGEQRVAQALQAIYEHIQYYYSVTGATQNKMRTLCIETAQSCGSTLDFSINMFEGVQIKDNTSKDNKDDKEKKQQGKSFDNQEQEYTIDNFLDEVYISEALYHDLEYILNHKYNLILQGAPGVGKTFLSKRLAYSLMGCRDEERIMMVQFHQSYSYEDFIMGYRPDGEGGFELKHGPFYEFCKKAEQNPDQIYYFIIDEINRGNLSRIFGELLMLIEQDKRGEKLRLLYEETPFQVPDNIRIIGMMNTADRSLAMIDYALRRRFSFVTIEPGFESDGFRQYQKERKSPLFNSIINEVKLLNEEIRMDPSLGSGFVIGHSYFCGEMNITKEWVTKVVKYELIPIIEEYWFDNEAMRDKWKTRLINLCEETV